MTDLLASTAAWQPFVTPAPLWDYWIWLAIPLCIAVAIVYKSAKVSEMKQLPRAAAITSVWIILAMVGLAIGLLLLVKWAGVE